MTSLRSKAPAPVGSSAWIAAERENALQFEAQDVEDFTYAARNDVEWLNEHMADIFSRNQIEVTEIFKTPGKLRGKTPRTARRRNPLEVRAPLTDVFAPNPQTSQQIRSPQQKSAPQFKVAEDIPSYPVISTKPSSYDQDLDQENIAIDNTAKDGDSMDVDAPTAVSMHSPKRMSPPKQPASQVHFDKAPVRTIETQTIAQQKAPIRNQPPARYVDETYASQSTLIDTQTWQSVSAHHASTQISLDSAYASQNSQIAAHLARDGVEENHAITSAKIASARQAEDDERSQSDGSSPDRPLIRKSSLNFASLPAREPLTTKKSFGPRPSRTSQLEQSKATGPTRASFLGREQAGEADVLPVSQATVAESTQALEVDLMALDSDANAVPLSDEENKTTKLHNKTSTQRLHDKISMLGQSHPRPTKSIPSTASQQMQPLYPVLSNIEKGIADAAQPKEAVVAVQQIDRTDMDEDDWTLRKPVSTSSDRPVMVKSHSADVMEQIQGKGSIGELQRDTSSSSNLNKPLPQSPLREAVLPGQQPQFIGHYKSASASIIPSPVRTDLANGFVSKMASASHPNLAVTNNARPGESCTPIGSPTTKRIVDGPISASKAKLSSILKSARGIFASSAGVSAQAKLETMSPRTMRLRDNSDRPLLSTVFSPSREHVPGSDLFSRMNASTKDFSRVISASSLSPSKDEGRRTRSSTEREEKKREKEAKERQKLETDLNKARVKEAQKASAYKIEKERVTSQEKQYNAIKEQQKAVKSMWVEQPTRKSPRKPKNQGVLEEATEYVDAEVQMTDAPITEIEPVGSQRLAQQQPKRQEARRPMRPIKDFATKSKPAPVSIRVGTASQWEADHRTMTQVHPSNSTLSSTLQDSLPQGLSRPGTAASKASTSTVNSQSTNNAFKGSVSSAASKPRALVAAAKKKEQEEREAQRKAQHKREIDRKRAAQQEEDRRQELAQRREAERQQRERSAQEETRRTAAKTAAEKKRLEATKKAETQRNPATSRMKPTAANLASDKSQISHQQRGELGSSRAPSRLNGAPSTRMMEDQQASRTINQPPMNPARPPKRALNPDSAEEAAKRPANKSGPNYLQTDGKRRRTNEELVETYEPRPPMAPPIRQSNMRTKEAAAKTNNLFPHGYTSVQATAQAHPAGAGVKPGSLVQASLQVPKVTHHLDMAKFATAKIPFGDGSANPVVGNSMHKTPVRPATATAKSSPRYQNGDSIELPEIATDSEDDEEDDFLVPDWAANSPIITDQLLKQDGLNPEDVFGPIAPLHMEDIFRNKERHHRFRQRTSSANWSGQDRLTQEEIADDMRAREHLRVKGHWTYGIEGGR
ncbi:MAG: hypothetical protein M1814_002148 [Vezdaea aestivalis]|nr:MAG: hypothetical protein M1814_002148 [Vezdaea aestivalis]